MRGFLVGRQNLAKRKIGSDGPESAQALSRIDFRFVVLNELFSLPVGVATEKGESRISLFVNMLVYEDLNQAQRW